MEVQSAKSDVKARQGCPYTSARDLTRLQMPAHGCYPGELISSDARIPGEWRLSTAPSVSSAVASILGTHVLVTFAIRAPESRR